MADLVVMASGSGSNFKAIAEKLANSPHRLRALICDKPDAYVLERAALLDIPAHLALYRREERAETEKEILSLLQYYKADLVALAGYMRVLTKYFISRFSGAILNIHPSLLPKYPGTRGLEDSFNSGDTELGITIHVVDEGVDTGPVILQKSIVRAKNENFDEIARRIHQLEHDHYPAVILKMLDGIDIEK